MARRFDSQSTTDQVLDGIDLTGKVAIVTGASGGLGAETARALASRGAEVTLTARDTAKAEAVAETIRAAHPGAVLDVRALALDRPESVRAFAKEWLADHRALHLLLNNAGVMACPLARTAEGFELQFATNHLGHFLLTGLLGPALRAGAPARVVNTSSGGHRFSGVVFEDIHFEKRPYDKWASYGQSKTANVLHAIGLEQRLSDRGIRAYAVHPGAILTDLARHMTEEDFERFRAQEEGGTLRLKTVEAGAATSVYTATAPELEGRGGLYLEDCGVAEINDSEEFAEGVRRYAIDGDNANRLWTLSEEMVGQSFTF